MMNRHWLIYVLAWLLIGCAAGEAGAPMEEFTVEAAAEEPENKMLSPGIEADQTTVQAMNGSLDRKVKDIVDLFKIALDQQMDPQFVKQARKMLMDQVGGKTPVYMATDTMNFKKFLRSNEPGHFSNIRIMSAQVAQPLQRIKSGDIVGQMEIAWEETVNKGTPSETWIFDVQLEESIKLFGQEKQKALRIKVVSLTIE